MTKIRTDRHGNLLVPNLILTEKRGVKTYTVAAHGRRVSTGISEDAGTPGKGFKAVLAAHLRIMTELGTGGGTHAPGGGTFADFWANHYRPDITVQTKTPLPRVQEDAAEYGDDKLIKWWLQPGQLGRMPLADVSVSYCKTLLARRFARKFRRSPKGPWLTPQASTVLREIGLLGSVWNYAIELEQNEKGATGVTLNPWPFVVKRIQKPDESEEAKHVFSLDDEAKVRAVLTPLYDRWFTFMVDTGVRIAGCTGVNPEKDIRWENGEPVAVHIVLKTLGKKKRTLWVPLMWQRTRDVVKTQLATEGRWWNAHYSRYPEVLRTACTRAGVDYRSPHKLRHTFATRYLQTPGCDLYTASLLLGHKNTAVTQRVYAHLMTPDLLARSKAWVAAETSSAPLGRTPGEVVPFPVPAATSGVHTS